MCLGTNPYLLFPPIFQPRQPRRSSGGDGGDSGQKSGRAQVKDVDSLI